MNFQIQLPPDFDEQIVATNSLIPAAREMSKALDTFASWALGGFAAALALFISNTDAHRWIGQDGFATSGRAFAFVLILTAVQKYISIIVTGLSVSHAAGATAAIEQAERRGNAFKFDSATLASLVNSAIWLLPNFIRKRIGKGVKAGDFMTSARNAMRLMQIQATLVLLIVILLLVAARAVAWH